MTEYLSFKIGGDTGILLAQIAQEHLIYTLDPDKAKRVFIDSFGEEADNEIILDLIIGKRIIIVDEEEQIFNVVERKDYPHLDSLYPKLDVDEWVRKQQTEIDRHTPNMEFMLDTMIREFRDKSYFEFKFQPKSIIDFIHRGQTDGVLSDLEDDAYLTNAADSIRLIKYYIEKIVKTANVIRTINAWYGTDHELDTYDPWYILEKLKNFLNANFHMIPEEEEDPTLDLFLNAQKEINEVKADGIKPVDIEEKWSAGWIDPNGNYYAINGEIANMLHIQLADMLQEAGIIPKDLGRENTPDSWLERNGWVKQHGNWILYDGWNNNRLSEPDVPMTDEQIKAIVKMGMLHYPLLKFGFRMERMTPTLFKMTEPLMKRKLFEL